MPTTARLNDKGTQHNDYYETVSIAGSPTVFIDGLSVARMGDAVDCGGMVNMTRMKSGKASKVRKVDRVGKQGVELHHIDEVANRGDVYNVDNPRVNTILTYTGDL
ncbi:PAAR domain-containing protein [Salmonella enterica subsp. enterica serovar Chester]|uniref:PAAR domain-containing protein n=1 Tax=Salmonella enterica TaxID=28901 RepID=UPI0033161946